MAQCEAVSKSGKRCTKKALAMSKGKHVCHLHSPALMQKRTAKMKRNRTKPGRKVRFNGHDIEVNAFGEFGAILLKAVRAAVRAELRHLVSGEET